MGHGEGEATILYEGGGRHRLVWQEVWGRADGHKVLQAPCAAATVHQHERVLRVRLQVCDQFPHGVPVHLHTLPVVQDLWGEGGTGGVFRGGLPVMGLWARACVAT